MVTSKVPSRTGVAQTDPGSVRRKTGFTGQDSFTYKVNDGIVDSAVATVTLVIS